MAIPVQSKRRSSPGCLKCYRKTSSGAAGKGYGSQKPALHSRLIVFTRLTSTMPCDWRDLERFRRGAGSHPETKYWRNQSREPKRVFATKQRRGRSKRYSVLSGAAGGLTRQTEICLMSFTRSRGYGMRRRRCYPSAIIAIACILLGARPASGQG